MLLENSTVTQCQGGIPCLVLKEITLIKVSGQLLFECHLVQPPLEGLVPERFDLRDSADLTTLRIGFAKEPHLIACLNAVAFFNQNCFAVGFCIHNAVFSVGV